MPNIIDMVSIGLRISTGLDNKLIQKYGLFEKFSLAVFGACEVDNNPHIFITRSNQQIQLINRHFYGTLNNYGFLVFAENQEQNEYYTFKDILLQPYKSYFILEIIKDVESHESRSHWTLMKNSKVKNNHKNKYGEIKTILSIWYFKRKRLP